MAHVEESGTGKKVNVDVNIVPFIDLMSVLIIFLLISAVWSQVSMIQIGSSVYGKKSEDVEPAKPTPRIEIPFRLDILSDGYRIVIGRQRILVSNSEGVYDRERLSSELKKIKELYPEKVDAVVTMGDDLKYGYLIQGMDLLLSAGFPEISISTAGMN